MAYASCHSASPGRALLLSTDASMYPHRAGECLACKYQQEITKWLEQSLQKTAYVFLFILCSFGASLRGFGQARQALYCSVTLPDQQFLPNSLYTFNSILKSLDATVEGISRWQSI